ncbi:MAG: M16 family metallopeptidase, partial [Gemmatimonadota bacterium]
SAGSAPPAVAAAPSGLHIETRYYTMPNGLKVVMSRDTTAPVAAVAVYYNIGFRIEPRERTGFAHLFEHMMFQGSNNLGKMEFIKLVQSNGGILNGSTRFDFTNYFEVVPSHTLETMLWAEADRMRGLAITQENLTNQQGVVKNEVRVNVLNRPYGGFPWLDMPQIANRNWYNAHNFYGELDDLDAATLEDVQSFFDTYYAPNNAVLVIVGDFDPEQAMAWVDEYFGDIPSADIPALPDLSEPRQEEEIRVQKTDSLANRPGLAFAYHVPPRNTPEWYAMGLLDLILLQGDDALLHAALVREQGMTGSVGGGINVGLGHMLNYNGPMLWTGSLFHDAGTSADAILAVVDSVIEGVHAAPLDEATLERARIKVRSRIYDATAAFFGFGRADLLASFALFDDDPGRINHLEEEFARVTPELVQATAQEYLRPTNRSVLEIVPGAAPPAAAEAGR